MFIHLLKKEWQENLWKLIFGGVVSLAFILLLLRARIFSDMIICGYISMIQMLVIPIIYSLDIFTGKIKTDTNTITSY